VPPKEGLKRECPLRQAAQAKLALTRFHAWVLLVDDVQAAFAAYDAAVFVAFFRGFQGAKNFHKSPVLHKEAAF
jgi:hypothetical protein